MTLVERHIVDVGREEVDEGRHHLAVLANGTTHHACVDVEVVVVVEEHLGVGLSDILTRILGDVVHRGDELEEDVALLDIETHLGVDMVFQRVDEGIGGALVTVDALEDGRLNFHRMLLARHALERGEKE